MSLKEPEIEAIVDHALHEVLLEVFDSEFNDVEEIDYALDYLREKVDELSADDFLQD